jgi:hypothetical protein
MLPVVHTASVCVGLFHRFVAELGNVDVRVIGSDRLPVQMSSAAKKKTHNFHLKFKLKERVECPSLPAAARRANRFEAYPSLPVPTHCTLRV